MLFAQCPPPHNFFPISIFIVVYALNFVSDLSVKFLGHLAVFIYTRIEKDRWTMGKRVRFSEGGMSTTYFLIIFYRSQVPMVKQFIKNLNKHARFHSC